MEELQDSRRTGDLLGSWEWRREELQDSGRLVQWQSRLGMKKIAGLN